MHDVNSLVQFNGRQAHVFGLNAISFKIRGQGRGASVKLQSLIQKLFEMRQDGGFTDDERRAGIARGVLQLGVFFTGERDDREMAQNGRFCQYSCVEPQPSQAFAKGAASKAADPATTRHEPGQSMHALDRERHALAHADA